MVKILVDENMPYARELFSRTGTVVAVPGRPLPAAELADADGLMVRSVTQVNEALLAGKPVKFVGTATAGTDHVDENWLQQAGIAFSAAPGCNAIAVVEYVFSSLLLLAERDGFQLRDRTVGIVGVGNVGGRLQKRLAAWGVKTLLCDPPRADRGDEGEFHSLETLVEQADILTIHLVLSERSRGLVDAQALGWMKPTARLVNTARGPIVDEQALLQALRSGRLAGAALDVFAEEPLPADHPFRRLPNVLATPHVGYVSEQNYQQFYQQMIEDIQAWAKGVPIRGLT